MTPTNFIPVCEPSLDGNELKYVTDCVKTNWISSHGRYIDEFEKKFSAYCNVSQGIACSNGTTALHLAIEAMGIGKGDEVIIPTFTMVASCNAVIYAGAKPVLVDSELETWNMDPEKIEEKITPKTKAIMVVHTYGHPVDMDKIKKIADKHHLPIIEDAAEAHGAEYKGKKTGGLSDIACFSFYANKILTCFPPNTKILIRPPQGGRGLSRMKKISDLKVGDIVLTYNTQTSEKQYKRVTRTFEREYGDGLLELTFSNNNHIQLTPNHPVYVINKGWVPAEQLLVGDEAIQYVYRGLAYKEMYAGKTYEDIMGKGAAEYKRRRHSGTLKMIHSDPKSRYNAVNWTEVAVKIGKANKGKRRSEEDKQILSIAQKKRWNTMPPSAREAFRDKMRTIGANPLIREKKRRRSLALAQDSSYREKLSRGVLRAMENDSYWEHYTKAMNLKPNKPEKKLRDFLERMFPGEFGYNGDYRLKVRIDRLIPDFVNTSGKKKVIDILGSYWHKKEEYEQRKERYARNGYDSLILWEHELKDSEALTQRIKTFIYNPNVKIVKITGIKKKEYSGKVYNIETEDNHNYFAHGILVHNCGEGGMVVTNNAKWAERARSLRNHYFGKVRFIHDDLGYNYRMTNIQAAIGLAQLEKIEDYIDARRKNAQLYNRLLKSTKGITTPPEASWAKNVYWMYGVLMQDEFGMSMPEVRTALEKKGIDTRTFFIGMHKQPAYKKPDPRFPDITGSYPKSDELERKGFYLPSGSSLTEEQITRVADALNSLK